MVVIKLKHRVTYREGSSSSSVENVNFVQNDYKDYNTTQLKFIRH